MQTKSASALFCLWLATALLWGCSSSGGFSSSLAAGTVSGVVSGAHPSQSASADSEDLLSRVASLVLPPVHADIVGLTPMAGATVQLVRLNSAGAVIQTIDTATTDSNGVYTFANTPPVTDSSLAVQAQDPSENGILMRAIVTGDAGSPESTAIMIAALRAQEFPVIASVLPAGTAWGSKSGWVPGIEHDVAFLGEPGGDGLRVLAVCTEGFAGRSGRESIREIAAALLPSQLR